MSFKALSLYFTPRMAVVLLLGFASGLPLALTASTLSAWLTEAKVDMKSIGLFASVATPYAFKFLWAPLIDSAPFPLLSRLLGRRRGWMVGAQCVLMAAILGLASADPAVNLWWVALMALGVATASATQDMVIDAYRVEILPPEQQGAGAATLVLGYRFGMVASGAGALFLAEALGWQQTYMVMAALVLIGMVTILLAPEPATTRPPVITQGAAHWLRHAVMEPFSEFLLRRGAVAMLLFILLYKFGDAFMGVMTTPFLLDIGFTKPQIASVLKLYGMAATIIGSLIGGVIVYRLGILRSLWVCGFGHAITNLMFVAQAQIGPDVQFLTLSITLENITGGMSTAAFVAFIGALCNVQFTATQYALLSSFSAVGRTFLSTSTGFAVEALGWPGFFVLATALALPGLVVLWWLQRYAGLTLTPTSPRVASTSE